MDNDHPLGRSGVVEPERTRRHNSEASLEFETDFTVLEAELESPRIIYFEEDNDRRQDCQILWSRWKMWAGTGCGRICIILLFVKILILSVLLPVVHLQEDEQPPHGHGNGVVTNWGYPNPYGNGGPEGGPDYSESVHVAPPTDQDQNGDATPSEGGVDVDTGDNIIVVRHENDALTVTPPPMEDHDVKSNTDATDAKDCPTPDNPLETKLESIISSITSIHSSIEKMESLMQATLMDDQRRKTISAIHSSNTSLALKHWSLILKYLPKDPSEALSTLIKEAYNGVPEVLVNLADFLGATSICSGWTTLYSEMHNYGHVFGGHPYIFPVTLRHHQSSCPVLPDHKIPPAVTSLLSGSFTLQNAGNSGYLYYAKRCVSRHYYHCLDVLTKTLAADEFDALEESSEEWRKYRWRVNASSASPYFLLLNEDRYRPYRLQDLSNSPRFKMEEASSQFEVELAYFQFRLENENQVQIGVRDTNMFLEGEEGQGQNQGYLGEVLLHSTHKTESGPTDKITWTVGQGSKSEEGKLRMGRSSGLPKILARFG